MQQYNVPISDKRIILALGAESAGNFSIYKSDILYHSKDFGDLLYQDNYREYERNLLEFLKKNKIKPDIILSDLHPLFKTTVLAQKLTKKYKAKYIPVQHHIAHIFSAIADDIIQNPKKLRKLKAKSLMGIALDGTGYGFDEKIWGGEIIGISNFQFPIFNKTPISNDQNSETHIVRIGHLENQILIGGEKAIKEPARIFISIASMIQDSRCKKQLKNIVNKFYSENQLDVLENQLQQKFNCIETSSCGRILDAVSLLLGFCKNERNYKHEPINLLEKNSGKPYSDLKPIIIDNVLQTTPLFEYLIKNLHKDKKRLAATAQLYIAKGLEQIIFNTHLDTYQGTYRDTYLSGGIANNKIISSYLESKGVYTSKKIPRGDAGISVGQIFHQSLQ